MKHTRIINLAAAAVTTALLAGCTTTESKTSAPLSVELETPIFHPEIGNLREVDGSAAKHAVFGGLVSWTTNSPQNNHTPYGELFWGILSWGNIDVVDGIDYANSPITMNSFGDNITLGRAAYNALGPTQNEVMLAPRYTINKSNYLIYSATTAKVKGTGAQLKSITPTGKVTTTHKTTGDSQRKDEEGLISRIVKIFI